MESIFIPQLLKAPEKTEDIQIQDFIAGLETLTPIRGQMKVRHGGTFLDVAVQAETIITLTCDRCLQRYNHRLLLDTSELIWLDRNTEREQHLPLEREVLWEDLSETLPSEGYFHPDTWLYEQLSLAMPLRKLCNQDCQQPVSRLPQSEPSTDSRWASLEVLKKQLSQ
jgi:uncharacterized protein